MLLELLLFPVEKLLKMCSFGEMEILKSRDYTQLFLERCFGPESSQRIRKGRTAVLCCSLEAEDQSEFASGDVMNADDEV